MSTRRDPSRGVSWGGLWSPPVKASTPAAPPKKTHSYLDSPGYCQLTFQKAEQALGFQDMSRLAEAITKLPEDDERFDTNERAALMEIARTPLKHLQELGIVRVSAKPGPGIDCC